MATELTVNETDAALVFTDNGVDLYLPNSAQETKAVTPQVLMATALAARLASDPEWKADLGEWFVQHMNSQNGQTRQ